MAWHERFFALRMTGCRDIHAFNKLSGDEIEKRLAYWAKLRARRAEEE